MDLKKFAVTCSTIALPVAMSVAPFVASASSSDTIFSCAYVRKYTAKGNLRTYKLKYRDSKTHPHPKMKWQIGKVCYTDSKSYFHDAHAKAFYKLLREQAKIQDSLNK